MSYFVTWLQLEWLITAVAKTVSTAGLAGGTAADSIATVFTARLSFPSLFLSGTPGATAAVTTSTSASASASSTFLLQVSKAFSAEFGRSWSLIYSIDKI